MIRTFLAAALLLSGASVCAADSPSASPAMAPSEIVAAAPASAWVAIAPADLLVMDLAPDRSRAAPRRVVIQLMPAPFSQGWIGNIRKLAAAHWWDGLSVNRVQDNYVVQWGDADGEDKAKARSLPAGLAVTGEADYVVPVPRVLLATPDGQRRDPPLLPEPLRWVAGVAPRADAYAPAVGFTRSGWPAGSDGASLWPLHCYGAVGVGRNLSPDAGTGAELYAVIGHAPRHLDRNIAVVGRVIEGIEHLSSLPRGTAALGFYDKPAGRVRITAIRPGTEVSGLPAYQALDTGSASFAAYAEARANRRDAFFIRPAGGADICNIPVPVRRAPR